MLPQFLSMFLSFLLLQTSLYFCLDGLLFYFFDLYRSFLLLHFLFKLMEILIDFFDPLLSHFVSLVFLRHFIIEILDAKLHF